MSNNVNDQYFKNNHFDEVTEEELKKLSPVAQRLFKLMVRLQETTPDSLELKQSIEILRAKAKQK
jgi:hypothetical protein